MATVFLTGYEGDTLDTFLEKIEDNGITAVIDIRELPLSRKSGFSKFSLEEALSSNGVAYYSFRELGSPSELRKELRMTHDYLSFFTEYRNYIHTEDGIVDNLANIVTQEDAPALLCFEKNTHLCHRTIVADELKRKYPRLNLISL